MIARAILQISEELLLIRSRKVEWKGKVVESKMTQQNAKDPEEQFLGTFIKSYSNRYEQWKRTDLLFVALQTMPKQVKKENLLKNLIKLNTEFAESLSYEG
jgi:spore cortex formation protein SpoVR/YcgB (stage V sporulation)